MGRVYLKPGKLSIFSRKKYANFYNRIVNFSKPIEDRQTSTSVCKSTKIDSSLAVGKKERKKNEQTTCYES
jgi:hypothetical protein